MNNIEYIKNVLQPLNNKPLTVEARNTFAGLSAAHQYGVLASTNLQPNMKRDLVNSLSTQQQEQVMQNAAGNYYSFPRLKQFANDVLGNDGLAYIFSKAKTKSGLEFHNSDNGKDLFKALSRQQQAAVLDSPHVNQTVQTKLFDLLSPHEKAVVVSAGVQQKIQLDNQIQQNNAHIQAFQQQQNALMTQAAQPNANQEQLAIQASNFATTISQLQNQNNVLQTQADAKAKQTDSLFNKLKPADQVKALLSNEFDSTAKGDFFFKQTPEKQKELMAGMKTWYGSTTPREKFFNSLQPHHQIKLLADLKPRNAQKFLNSVKDPNVRAKLLTTMAKHPDGNMHALAAKNIGQLSYNDLQKTFASPNLNADDAKTLFKLIPDRMGTLLAASADIKFRLLHNPAINLANRQTMFDTASAREQAEYLSKWDMENALGKQYFKHSANADPLKAADTLSFVAEQTSPLNNLNASELFNSVDNSQLQAVMLNKIMSSSKDSEQKKATYLFNNLENPQQQAGVLQQMIDPNQRQALFNNLEKFGHYSSSTKIEALNAITDPKLKSDLIAGLPKEEAADMFTSRVATLNDPNNELFTNYVKQNPERGMEVVLTGNNKWGFNDKKLFGQFANALNPTDPKSPKLIVDCVARLQWVGPKDAQRYLAQIENDDLRSKATSLHNQRIARAEAAADKKANPARSNDVKEIELSDLSRKTQPTPAQKAASPIPQKQPTSANPPPPPGNSRQPSAAAPAPGNRNSQLGQHKDEPKNADIELKDFKPDLKQATTTAPKPAQTASAGADTKHGQQVPEPKKDLPVPEPANSAASDEEQARMGAGEAITFDDQEQAITTESETIEMDDLRQSRSIADNEAQDRALAAGDINKEQTAVADAQATNSNHYTAQHPDLTKQQRATAVSTGTLAASDEASKNQSAEETKAAPLATAATSAPANPSGSHSISLHSMSTNSDGGQSQDIELTESKHMAKPSPSGRS